jgi:hypothetical protein
MRKKKNNNQKKISYLLDTSIQIEKCKYPKEVSNFLEKKRSGECDFVSSFFVLYEFRTGLLKSIIDFYFSVKAYNDISYAFAKWSDKFQFRQVKNIVAIQAVVYRITQSIKTNDIDDYLKKLQAVIFHLEVNFSTHLSSIVGEFQNDELIKLSIKNENEYKEFSDAYNKRKCIPLISFWEKYSQELDSLLSDKDFQSEKKLQSMYKYLQDIKIDVYNSNKINHNKGIGDAVIAVDCGKKRTIMSFDNSFSFLCPPLNRKFEILNKTNLS